jgi:outer membrane protein assembly factor BamD
MRLRFVTPLAALVLAACGQEKTLTAREYHDLAAEAMREQAYDLAVDNYQKLLEEYPFSEYTDDAQLHVAYAQYLDKRYPEAIASFEDFERMHPTSPNLPFVEYHLALSYMDQMGKRDRDQKAAENAAAHFQALIDRYPDSGYAVKARQKLRETREVLASHELSIVRFYFTWGNPLGAEARLRLLLQTYPDTGMAAEGLFTLGEYLRKRGDVSRAAVAYAALVEQYATSPRMPEARSAVERLRGRGVAVPDQPLVALMDTLGRRAAKQVEGPRPAAPAAPAPGGAAPPAAPAAAATAVAP